MNPSLPTISIVVPNYNGGGTIGKTLQSLIEQEYPALEILVVDGGSTDDSVDVIRSYEPHLAWWVSERDRGQTHAINKGFARASGDVVNWLCSDDYLLPGALAKVGQSFAGLPETDVVAGRCRVESPQGTTVSTLASMLTIELMPCMNSIAQPSCFFRRRLLEREPPLDESFHYAMDFELWNYFKSRDARWCFLDEPLSVFVNHASNKSSTGGVAVAQEMERIYRRYSQDRIPLTLWYRTFILPMQIMRRRGKYRPLRGALRPLYSVLYGLLDLTYGRERVRAMDWTYWYG